MNAARPPLTIAGSDPTGGAGVEADLKVFLAHGLSGVAVTTCLTAQDTVKVHEVWPVPARSLRSRLDVLLGDVNVGGGKIGAVASAGAIREIAAALRSTRLPHLILDPVLAPTAGVAFADERQRRAMIRHLLPLVDVLTPNLEEAAALLQWSIDRVSRSPVTATAALRALGPSAVLLKGGHGQGREVIDYLDDAGQVTELRHPRVVGPPVHGTGCALSAALLAALIQGHDPAAAAARATDYVHRAIAGATSIGAGQRQLRFVST